MFICYIYRHLCFDDVYMPIKNLNLNLKLTCMALSCHFPAHVVSNRPWQPIITVVSRVGETVAKFILEWFKKLKRDAKIVDNAIVSIGGK